MSDCEFLVYSSSVILMVCMVWPSKGIPGMHSRLLATVRPWLLSALLLYAMFRQLLSSTQHPWLNPARVACSLTYVYNPRKLPREGLQSPLVSSRINSLPPGSVLHCFCRCCKNGCVDRCCRFGGNYKLEVWQIGFSGFLEAMTHLIHAYVCLARVGRRMQVCRAPAWQEAPGRRLMPGT